MKVSLVLVLILLLALAACPFVYTPLDRLVHGRAQSAAAVTVLSDEAEQASALPALPDESDSP